ncbi:hypothetical protein [Paenibacillus odorifer]|uniref:Homeodomain phBC6A51-type domain-containing protein n=1 Tax=Paenibacillus odorifer TaxID=189426 RepID=A0A1R0Y6N9_9BACL|nr:hypothetical protein [Paenibacillus odorifer]OMD43020.1 hypothetical protein BSK52_05840 [Paenibacillus odorifer]
MAMTIYDVLKKLPYKKQLYIKYKFNIWMQHERNMTEEEFLKQVDLKGMGTYYRWERSPEYKHIVSIVLAAKQANDLLTIYENLKKKVESDPNPKDIEMMLKLMKEINLHNKEAERFFSASGKDEEDDDLEM